MSKTSKQVESNVFETWQNRPFLWASLLNFVLFGVIYAFFTPHFQENDDVGMMLEAAGELLAVESTPYLLFTNILVGFVLQSLYDLLPSVAWYAWYLVFVLWLSHVGLLYVLLKKLDFLWANVFFIIYFVLLSSHPLTSFQFTTVAALASMSGFALLIFLDKSSHSWVLGIILVLLGALVRFQSAILALVMFAPVLLYYIWQKRDIKIFIPLGIVSVLLLGVFGIQKVAYQQADWAEFAKTNALIGEFVDNQVLSKAAPEAQEKALKKANWTIVDYAMMGNWFFVDKNLYSYERCSAALAELGVENRTFKSDEIFEYQQKEILARPAIQRSLALCLFFALFLGAALPQWLCVGFSVLMMPFLLAMIHFLLKQAPMHVYHPMFMHLAILPVFFLDKEKLVAFRNSAFGIQKIGLVMLGFFVLSLCFGVFSEINQFSKQTKENRRNLKNLVSNLNPKGNNLYVVWANSFPYEWLSPFEDISYLKELNVFSLGSMQRTPTADKVLEKYQITNIYTALGENPSVFFLIRADYLQRWLGLYAQFMEQHYKKKITARSVLQVGNAVVVDVDFVP